MRPGDLARRAGQVALGQFGGEAHLVQVTVTGQEKDAVRMPLLERDQSPREAHAAVAAVHRVAAKDKIRAVVREFELVRRGVAQDAGMFNPLVEVIDIALDVGHVADLDASSGGLDQYLLAIYFCSNAFAPV